MVKDLQTTTKEAQTTAAHYKLQHQMSQMESTEAVERMAVEMDMARRELEVVQKVEVERQYRERKQSPIKAEQDPNFRMIHVDVYTAMMQDIQTLKSQNAHLDSTVAHQKKIIWQQESELASLTDRVSLMRERIREGRDQQQRQRRSMASYETTPRTAHSTPYQTPRREHTATSSSRQQHGFAALLQATDLVTQSQGSGTRLPSGHHKASHSASSVPTTPRREQARPAVGYYTPQQPSRPQLQVPHTAPLQRKRSFQELAPTREEPEPESDATVSATEDSEAETEVPDREDEGSTSRVAADILQSPSAGRGKGGFKQLKLFGHVTKPNVHRVDEADRGVKRSKVGRLSGDSVGLGIEQDRT